MSDSFECLIYDADIPSMTARFRIPEEFPFAGGVYRIERIRTATAADKARWDHYDDPPELSDV